VGTGAPGGTVRRPVRRRRHVNISVTDAVLVPLSGVRIVEVAVLALSPENWLEVVYADRTSGRMDAWSR
jgi:hypothetical protein